MGAATGYETPRRAPRRDLGHELGRAELGRTEGIVGQLDWMLGRLRAARVRITFARIELRMDGEIDRRAAERIAEELDDSFGLAGMLPDGSVMAAFFGPRQAGCSGDRQQSQAIQERLERVLSDVAGNRAAIDATVFLLHRWTDEIGDMPSLMLEAMSGPRARATRMELVLA